MEPATLSLELAALFLGAGSLAACGVLASLLAEPARGAPSSAPRIGRPSLFVGLVLRPVVTAAVATLALLGVLALVPLRIGSGTEVDLAAVTGAVGGIVVVGLSALVLALGPAAPSVVGRTYRGWVAAAAIVAGTGAVAVLTLVGAYLALGGHVPAMVATALGAAVVSMAARAGGVRAPARALGEDAPDRSSEWVRTIGPRSVEQAIDLYLALVFAAVGASLLAYIPSAVRTVQINAVLFPIVALATVLVSGLLALPFAVDASSGPRSRSPVGSLAVAAFASIGLLAVLPIYLPGGLGFWGAAVVGVVGATAVVSVGDVAGGGASRGAPPRLAKVVVPFIVLAAVAMLAFRFSNGTTLAASDVSGPTLGAYGIGLASVAAAGTFGGLVAIDLGRRFADFLPPNGADQSPGSGEPPRSYRGGVASAVDVGAYVTTGLAGFVFLMGLLYLIPVEIGLAPGSLAAAAQFTQPGFVVGVTLGIAIPTIVVGMGPSNSLRRIPLCLALGVGGPVLAGWSFGAGGLLGFATGALVGGLGLGIVGQLWADPAFLGEATPPPVASTIALTMIATLAFAGALLAASVSGRF